MNHRILTASLALSLVASVGCGGDKETSAPAKSADASAPVDAAKPADAAKPEVAEKTKVVDGGDPADERFAVNIEPPADAAVGAEGKVKLTIVPKAPWHMNLDYPTSLAVSSPSDVTLAKETLAKDDLVRLDDEGCEMEVAFTPTAAGDKSFTAQLKFAVCQDDACAPVTKDVEFKVAVK
ncbi:MAG: hypothetical protein R3A79_18410 [Nannocystaceae bacterium]